VSDKVFLKSLKTYNQTDVDEAIEKLFDDCGIDELLSDKRHILLKPNLLMKARPDEAVTTNPAVIAAVIKSIRRRTDAEIVIADSPGGTYNKLRMASVYETCGIEQFDGRDGVTVNRDYTSRPSEFSDGDTRKQFDLIEPYYNADIIFNLAKLKTHEMSGMTGAVKNNFGFIPGLMKPEVHCLIPDKDDFCDFICRLAEFVAPAVNVVDAVVGMEGDGPSGGRPRTFGFIGVSRSPFLLDRVMCHLIGFEVGSALTVKASVKRGLAPENIADIEVCGDTELMNDPITDLLMPKSRDTDFVNSVPKFLRKPTRKFLEKAAAHPKIDVSKCVGCGRCAEICPQQTIKIADKKAVIEYKKCIRCFCCHEVCPMRAIDVKRSRVWKI